MWSGQTSWGQYFGVGEIEMVIVPKLFISWLHMTTHNVCPGTLFTMPHAAAPAMTYVRHRPTRCVFSFRSKVFSDRHYVACAISSLVYSMIIMIDGRRLKCVIEARLSIAPTRFSLLAAISNGYRYININSLLCPYLDSIRHDVFPRKEVPFGGRDETAPHLGVKCPHPKNPVWA